MELLKKSFDKIKPTMRALFIISISILSIFEHHGNIKAQCPAAFDCEASVVLCSIDALNGFTCNNPVMPNAGFPLPNLCFGTGAPHNLGWWAFIANGGVLSITFNFDITGCENGQGIQAGVFTRFCDGQNIFDCDASCNTSTFSLTGATKPCETYYVWVDGCNSDVCTYTMTVNGSGGAPSLPPLPSITTNDRVCPCGTFEVCRPELPGGCEPTIQWTVDGKLQDRRNDCIWVNVQENAKPGDSITICMIATIGNPDVPGGICDQDMVCTEFIIEPIPKDSLNCEVVCHEDTPIKWQGSTIQSSCISPPCSVRIDDRDGCCIDLYKSWIILPPPSVGKKDTFICRVGIPFLAENRRVYPDEVCDETINFQKKVTDSACTSHPVLCDTSYVLNIFRFDYSYDLELFCDSCSGSLRLHPNVAYKTHCPKFKDSIQVDVEWSNSITGEILDTMKGDSFIIIDIPGRYCFHPIGYYKDEKICTALAPQCIYVSTKMLNQEHEIEGPEMICLDSSNLFSISDKTDICQINWFVEGQGSIIGSLDSNAIVVQWDSLAHDTTKVCANLKTHCSEYQICKQVLICHKTTSTNVLLTGELYYSYPTQNIIWKGLNSNMGENWLNIYNIYGQLVLKKSIAIHGQMDIESLTKGIYFIRISNKEKPKGMTLKVIR